MKSLGPMFGWAVLFGLSLSIGWYLSRPSETIDTLDPAAILAKAKPLYVTHCARCHGAQGEGEPAMMAALQPPPRDFRERPWKNPVTQTAIGRIILTGIPGSAMTPYRGILSQEQVDLLSSYVLHLSDMKTTDTPSINAKESSSSVKGEPPFLWHAAPQPLPETQLVAGDGQRVNLTDIAQQPLLIHFWGTTCVHCLAEMTQMRDKGLAKDAQPLRIISICVDSTLPSEANELVQRFAPGHVVYVDPLGLVGQKFGVSALPAYRVINGGKVLASHIGTLPWDEIDLPSLSKRTNR